MTKYWVTVLLTTSGITWIKFVTLLIWILMFLGERSKTKAHFLQKVQGPQATQSNSIQKK